MRARLARLTPSSRDKKKKTDPPVRSLGRTTNIRFHGIEGLCCQHSFSFHLKFTVRQTRLMAALLAVVCGHGLPVHVFESGEDSRRRAWLIEIQMSISSVRAYILTRRRGEERSEFAECFSCRGCRKRSPGSRPCLLSNSAGLDGWLEFQGCLRLVNVVL